MYSSCSDRWKLHEDIVCKVRRTQTSGQCRQRRASPKTTCDWQAQSSPDIIVLCLWWQASQQHIAHYIKGYAELFPTATVLLSHQRSPGLNKCQDTEAVLDKLIDAQPDRAAYSGSTCSVTHHKKDPSILLHLFGTGGANGACEILRGFRLRTGMPLNVGAIIADTEPTASLTTFFSSSQPLSSTVLSFILAFWLRLLECMFVWPTEQDYHELHDSGLLPSEVRRCFVFTHGLMLTWMSQQQSVQRYSNDEQYERKEQRFRRSSIDQKGRWCGDQERYWSGIESLWAG